MQASSPVAPARSRRWLTVLIVLIGLSTLVGFLLLRISAGHSLRLRTCFQDANGLGRGSKVRLAGVDIGFIREVRAQPTDKACPGAVEMEIRTPYELRIPKDSVASTATAGVLGPTYLEIDVSGASGPPVQGGGQLPSRESVKFTDQALRAIESLKQRFADQEKNRKTEPPKHQHGEPSATPSPSSVPK